MQSGYYKKWFWILELKFQRALFRPYLTSYWGKLNIFNCSQTNRSRVPAQASPTPQQLLRTFDLELAAFLNLSKLAVLASWSSPFRSNTSNTVSKYAHNPNFSDGKVYCFQQSWTLYWDATYNKCIGWLIGFDQAHASLTKGDFWWSRGKVETSKQQSVTLWSASRGEQYKIPTTYPSGL